MLIDRLFVNTPLDEPTILKFPVAYRTDINRNLLELLESKCVYYELIPTITAHICRVTIPTSLRHTNIDLMHTTPVAGHMGEYKILYRIRLRLFWLRLRSDFPEWTKKCPHYMLTYRWRRYVQKIIVLLFSLFILLINVSLMMFSIGGLSGTSIIWMIQIFLHMVLVCFLAQNRNQI